MLMLRTLRRGGAEIQMVNLALGLKRLGHDVVVAVFYGGGALEDRLQQHDVSVLDLGKAGRWDLLSFNMALHRAVREQAPDVVHTMFAEPNIFAAGVKLLHPEIALVWGVRSAVSDKERFPFWFRLNWRLEAGLSRCPERTVTNSCASRDILVREGFPASRTEVVHNGIDVDRFRPDADARRRFRAELGVEPHQALVATVARIDPVKDHSSFLEAAARFGARSDVVFAAVGGGPRDLEERLRGEGRRLGLTQFRWVGEREDMVEVYNGIDVVVLPSLSESFPNVLAESMACGTPCVATDVGASREIVGELGWIVSPGDPEALFEALGQAIQEVRGGAGYRADVLRGSITRRFTVEEMVRRTSEVIEAARRAS